ncbi:MAG TPA: anthranilate phosphoribosyltransferase, partial [Wenzhouxiangella sp.]
MSTATQPIQQALHCLIDGQDIPADLMTATMAQIMQGEADPATIGGLLVGLRIKGESVDEIAAAAAVMRRFATPVEVDVDGLTDIVGTGGDGASTFNVSTAASFVAAAGGVRMAKHGNRSVSSRS